MCKTPSEDSTSAMPIQMDARSMRSKHTSLADSEWQSLVAKTRRFCKGVRAARQATHCKVAIGHGYNQQQQQLPDDLKYEAGKASRTGGKAKSKRKPSSISAEAEALVWSAVQQRGTCMPCIAQKQQELASVSRLVGIIVQQKMRMCRLVAPCM